MPISCFVKVFNSLSYKEITNAIINEITWNIPKKNANMYANMYAIDWSSFPNKQNVNKTEKAIIMSLFIHVSIDVVVFIVSEVFESFGLNFFTFL